MCISSISGCSDEKQNKAKQSAVEFIQQLKQRLPFTKKEDKSKTIPAVTYTTQKLASPFRDQIEKKVDDTDVILKGEDVNRLKLVGIVMRHDKKWAIVSGASGELHALTVGYTVGKQHAVVKKITDTNVELQTKTSDSNPYSSIFTLTLQEWWHEL